ncbi:MAG TPA: glycerophosphodiester phosphodiesterase family protein [Candidatus Saccharimonadales bacterium]
MKIIAHRGVRTSATENSLPALQAAVAEGMGVECDIRSTGSGRLVLCHDKSLRRVANLNLAVADITDADLGQIRLAGGEPLALAETVIEQILPQTFVNFEFKDSLSIKPLITKLAGTSAPHGLLLSTRRTKDIRLIKGSEFTPGLIGRVGWLTLNKALRLGVNVIIIRGWWFNRFTTTLAKRFGLRVYIYGRSYQAANYAAKEVEGLIVDVVSPKDIARFGVKRDNNQPEQTD